MINQVVLELSSLGLSPDVLHDLLKTGELEKTTNTSERPADTISAKEEDSERAVEIGATRLTVESKPIRPSSPRSKAVYELIGAGDKIEPRLRLWVGTADLSDQIDESGSGSAQNSPTEEARVAIFLETDQECRSLFSDSSDRSHSSTEDLVALSKPIASKKPGHSLLWTLQCRDKSPERRKPFQNIESFWDDSVDSHEVVEDLSTIDSHGVGLVKHRYVKFMTQI